VLVRRRGRVLEPLVESEAWGLRSRNKEQRFAMSLLLDPAVPVVALDGRAGTGKTLCAVAAGLEQVVEQRRYARLCVYRPVIPVGKADLGYLPGALDEKLDPWMAAIIDAISALTERRSPEDARQVIDAIKGSGQLVMESVAHLRGRTLHNSFVIVDEAQNLPPDVIKTILTRLGDGSKVVFTGDTSQIDAAFLSEATCGLSVLVSVFTGNDVFGHVRLTKGERSRVAELAATLL
jgi:PhoH-like ATPase